MERCRLFWGGTINFLLSIELSGGSERWDWSG